MKFVFETSLDYAQCLRTSRRLFPVRQFRGGETPTNVPPALTSLDCFPPLFVKTSSLPTSRAKSIDHRRDAASCTAAYHAPC